MKLLLFISIILLNFFQLTIKAQSPSCMLDWACKAGNVNIDKATGIAHDATGNVYTVGYFGGVVDFNPGAGSFTLSAVGGYDAFIQKLDINGNFVSAYSFGNANNDIINSISIDASNNIFIGGYFTGTNDFDLGAGITSLNSGTLQSAFITKYSSAFSLTWAKMLTGSSTQYVNSLAVDNTGSVYSTGGIGAGVIDFDPNAATSNFTVTSGSAFFVHKLSSAGNLVWAKGFVGANGTVGNSITIDNNGDPIIGGKFVTSVDFDPNLGVVTYTTYNSSDDAFVLKLNASGNYQFAFPIGVGSASGNDDDAVHCVKIDNSNNIYLAGRFSRTVDFDPGAGTYTMAVTFNSNSSVINQDAFVAKYSSTGVFAWATNLNLNNTGEIDYADGMDVSVSGNVFVASTYATASSYGTKFSKFSTAGVFVYGKVFSTAAVSDVKLDLLGDLLMVGNFIGTTDFDPSPYFVTNLVSAGQDDAFTAKFSECATPASSGTLAGATVLCNGSINTYSIQAISGAESYTWSNTLSMVGTSTTNVISLTSANTATTGAISVVGYNHCGNAPTQTIQVTVTPNTTVNVASSATSVCAGNSVTLTASGATTYSWATGETTASIVKNPTSTTIYTVTGYNGNCSNTKTVSVIAQTLPFITVSVNQPTAGCAGSQVYLTASGATSYSWNTGALTNTINVAPSATTIYTVTGTNAAGCSATTTQTVYIQSPVLVATASPYTVCPGGVSTLSVSGAQSYTWNGPGGTTTGNIRNVSPTVTSTYVVGGTGFTGCISQTNIVIYVASAISLSTSASSSISCSGAPVVITVSGASTYTWVNNGLTTNTISVAPTVATTYTVNGASGSCTGTKTISISVATSPNVLALTNTTLLCTGQSANLTASVTPFTPGMTYTWSTGQTLTTISVSPTITTTYSVTGKSINGCSTIASITQSVSVCTVLSENGKMKDQITVYPNPSSGSITIVSLNEKKFEILNQLGQIVFVFEIKNDPVKIDISILPSGIYYLRDLENSISKKIILE